MIRDPDEGVFDEFGDYVMSVGFEAGCQSFQLGGPGQSDCRDCTPPASCEAASNWSTRNG